MKKIEQSKIVKLSFGSDDKNDPSKTYVKVDDCKVSKETTSLAADAVDALNNSCKNISGIEDLDVTFKILSILQRGVPEDDFFERVNVVAALLPHLKQQDPLESFLLGQFLTLHQSAMQCLGKTNQTGDLQRQSHYADMAKKFFRIANETLLTLTRLRTAGKQTISIMHINANQAVAVQNLNQAPGEVGSEIIGDTP